VHAPNRAGEPASAFSLQHKRIDIDRHVEERNRIGEQAVEAVVKNFVPDASQQLCRLAASPRFSRGGRVHDHR
jgi:hypothetical protein